MNKAIGILAQAYYLPAATRTAAAIFQAERIPGTPLAAAVDFRKDLGIDRVHVAEGQEPSALGLEAARRALAQASLDPRELDLIVDYTSIPEDFVAPTWAAAGQIQAALGAERALAVAVNTGGCASYHVALKYAAARMEDDPQCRTALLFSGNKAPASNRTYYPITLTCDSGGAFILKRGEERRTVRSVEVSTLGELHDVWWVPGLGGRKPGEPASERLLHMHSDMERFNSGVIKINLFMFRKVMRAALKRAGLTMKDVNCYIYPSFSTWDQKSFCTGLGIDPAALYTDGLRGRGHLQENDMVANYQDAADSGRIKQGDIVMVTTNGAGFTWGAAVVRH